MMACLPYCGSSRHELLSHHFDFSFFFLGLFSEFSSWWKWAFIPGPLVPGACSLWSAHACCVTETSLAVIQRVQHYNIVHIDLLHNFHTFINWARCIFNYILIIL